jgi:bifunctional non-homologous end joining protein LigD
MRVQSRAESPRPGALIATLPVTLPQWDRMPDKPAPDLDQLLRYRQKRDFSKTPEPESGAPRAADDLTFVVQQHRATRMHWDFRLEVDGVLVSWAVPRGPSLNPQDKRMAAHVEDHPFDYGGFEGVIPKGNYGAGEVIVWDNGTYTPDEDGELSWGDRDAGNRRMREGLGAGKISITMRGKKLRGSWTLVKTKQEPNSWLLIKHRDEYASTRDVLEEDKSVISGLSVKDIKDGRMPSMASSDGGAKKPHPQAKEATFPDPRQLRPMLPTLVEKAFSRAGWLFEAKLDGVRTLAFLRDGDVELRSRRGNPATVQYPEVRDAVGAQRAKSAVFDGEIVALNDHGVPDFQQIQPRINLGRPAEVERIAAQTPVYYYVFDLLYLDGYDLTGLPLSERKQILWRTLEQGDHIKYVEHIQDDGLTMNKAAMDVGFEGVVGKRASSAYEPGVRSRSWLKVKNVNEQEFVVGGYTEGEGSRAKTFGGLLVGYYDDGDLRFASSVGSGLTDAMLSKITAQLKTLRVDESPFVNPPTTIGGRWAGGRNARPYWVRPEVVAQVKFSSWTRDGNLRAPVFVGLREDIDPRSIRREDIGRQSVDVIIEDDPLRGTASATSMHALVASVVEQLDAATKDTLMLEVGGARVKLTNLSKEFWPATAERPARTKRDMIRYYARVAPYLLPHLKDRPLTLTRYPNGIDGGSFYQKHWPQPFPRDFTVERVALYSAHNDEDGDYIMANNFETLMWLSQLANLEIHAWMARIDPEPDARHLPTTFAGSEENIEASVLNYPDYMVFDLDPYIYAGTEKKGEEPALNRRAFEKTREMALALKEILQQLRLSSFVKTTGKTGLHIYVPVLRQYNYDQIRAASQAVGAYMVRMYPKDVTMEWMTTKRTGKVFFDHNQNSRGKTLAAQYSLRPHASAAASAPLTWEELAHAYPTDFDIDTLPERVERVGDIWANILDAKQDLRALIEAGA